MLYGTRKWNRGSSLLEVMISLFVLVTGLLGFSAMQLDSMQRLSHNKLYSRAIWIACSIADSLRANRDALQNGHYDGRVTSHPGARDCRSRACSSSELADFDRALWHEAVSVLPRGQAFIERTPSADGQAVTITLCWGPELQSDSADCARDAGMPAQATDAFRLRLLL
ncbi:MAG: type IV pilus modification protein PilV [Gammaproteobacteria bacterium]